MSRQHDERIRRLAQEDDPEARAQYTRARARGGELHEQLLSIPNMSDEDIDAILLELDDYIDSRGGRLPPDLLDAMHQGIGRLLARELEEAIMETIFPNVDPRFRPRAREIGFSGLRLNAVEPFTDDGFIPDEEMMARYEIDDKPRGVATSGWVAFWGEENFRYVVRETMKDVAADPSNYTDDEDEVEKAEALNVYTIESIARLYVDDEGDIDGWFELRRIDMNHGVAYAFDINTDNELNELVRHFNSDHEPIRRDNQFGQELYRTEREMNVNVIAYLMGEDVDDWSTVTVSEVRSEAWNDRCTICGLAHLWWMDDDEIESILDEFAGRVTISNDGDQE